MKTYNRTILVLTFLLTLSLGGEAFGQSSGMRAYRNAKYRRYNERYQQEVQAQMAREQWQQYQQIESIRAESAQIRQLEEPRQRIVEASRTPSPSRGYNDGRDPLSLRPDVSVGLNGQLGTPGLRAYSKDIRTGHVIPSDMIPKGYGRYYTTVDPR